MITGLSPSLLRPPATETPEGRSDRLREVAREFEAVFLEIILRQMRTSNQALGGGEKPGMARQTYEGWQDTMFAKNIAGGQGIGLGEMLYRQLQQEQLRQQAKAEL